MADLTLDNSATLIERAVFNRLNRAYRARLPAAADVAALRAMVTRGSEITTNVFAGYQREDHDLVYVTSKLVCYEWDTFSTAADDGDATVKPTDAGSNGRWLKTTSTVQTGYLRDVRLYEGEQTEKEFLERLLARLPSMAVRWVGANNVPKSQIPGALYRYETDLEVWAASTNLRGGPLAEGVVGSSIAAELAADPGVNTVLGHVKKALAGATGEALGQPGIAYCEIGREQPVYRSLAERRFVYSLAVQVRATVHAPDEYIDPGVAAPLTDIDVIFQVPQS